MDLGIPVGFVRADYSQQRNEVHATHFLGMEPAGGIHYSLFFSLSSMGKGQRVLERVLGRKAGKEGVGWGIFLCWT